MGRSCFFKFLLVAFAGFNVGCAAATPAVRWDAAERGRISNAYPTCEFFEDEEAHSAGYACEMGTFSAYDIPSGGTHEKTARHLAEQYAKKTFTAPLHEVTRREPIKIGGDSFDASIASYQPEPGTIIPPEVMMILTPQDTKKPRAFTCAATLLAALDTEESIKKRVEACMQGLQLLVEASR